MIGLLVNLVKGESTDCCSELSVPFAYSEPKMNSFTAAAENPAFPAPAATIAA